MDQIISAGLLAYGMSGKVFHAPFLAAHPGFKLHAVLERHTQKAVLDYPDIVSYDHIEALLSDEQLDLIVINTPNFSHYDYARQALEAGKHILVEKPFTATSAEAETLFQLAEEKGKKIFVYQNRRWDSDFTQVRELISSGVLGKLSEVNFRYDLYRPAIGPKTFKEEAMPASGLVYDLGPHLLDQVISLFGAPESFHKVTGRNRPGTKVDDYFSIQLSYPDSLQVLVQANMLVTDMQPAFVLQGAQGSLVKYRADVQEKQLQQGLKPGGDGYGQEEAGREARLTLQGPEGQKNTQLPAAGPSSYLGIFEAVYQSVVNDVPFPVKPEQILAQLRILEA